MRTSRSCASSSTSPCARTSPGSSRTGRHDPRRPSRAFRHCSIRSVRSSDGATATRSSSSWCISSTMRCSKPSCASACSRRNRTFGPNRRTSTKQKRPRPSPTGWRARNPRAIGRRPTARVASRRASGLLARLVNDLQWRYTLNEAKRRFTKSLTTRTSYIFVFTLAAFAALVFLKFRSLVNVGRGDPKLLFVAMAVGARGAGFSMLTGLKGQVEGSELYDLNLMRAYMMLVSRALIGAGAASILYFFLLSGLLSGKAFPELEAQAPAPGRSVVATSSTVPPAAPALQGADRQCANGQPCLTFTDISLLVVWCFIAGFSEKLVPGLLARTEARVDSQQGQDPIVSGLRSRPDRPPRPPATRARRSRRGHKPMVRNHRRADGPLRSSRFVSPLSAARSLAALSVASTAGQRGLAVPVDPAPSLRGRPRSSTGGGKAPDPRLEHIVQEKISEKIEGK